MAGEKYFKSDTSYSEGEAEHDAADWNFQVVDHSADIICMCSTAEDRDMILKLLNDHAGK